ncbi:MAG: nuclear transport factor 2 family protein [Pseudomonadota bacterium]
MAICITTEDREIIVETMFRYFWLIDHGRASEVADLFAADGTLELAEGTPTPGRFSRREIEEAMVKRQTSPVWTRHVVSNVVLEALDGGLVAATSMLTLYRGDRKLCDACSVSVGDIKDTFVRAGRSWRIQSRFIEPIFVDIG